MTTKAVAGHQQVIYREEAVQHLVSTINQATLNPVTLERIQRAVTLPCGHNMDEITALQLLAGPISQCKCPMDRIPFQAFGRNTALQNIIDATNSLDQAAPDNPSVQAMVRLERAALNSPSMEATAHYERGKQFAEQGDHEQAIQACLAAVVLSPDFAKAHAYLHFLLDQQGRVPSVSQPPSLLPEVASTQTSTQDNEGICNSPINGNGAPLRARPDTVAERPRAPSEHVAPEIGITGAVGLYFRSLYELAAFVVEQEMYVIEQVSAYTGADRVCTATGEAIGNVIYEVGSRTRLL